MTFRCWILACAMALSWPVAAHEPDFCGRAKPHPIDVAFGKAIEASGGVTYDIREAQGTAYAAWDRELNAVYGRLIKRLPKQQAAALRSAQRAWLAWSKAQDAAEWSRFAEGGTSGPIAVSDIGRERLRARVCELTGWEQDLDGGG